MTFSFEALPRWHALMVHDSHWRWRYLWKRVGHRYGSFTRAEEGEGNALALMASIVGQLLPWPPREAFSAPISSSSAPDWTDEQKDQVFQQLCLQSRWFALDAGIDANFVGYLGALMDYWWLVELKVPLRWSEQRLHVSSSPRYKKGALIERIKTLKILLFMFETKY